VFPTTWHRSWANRFFVVFSAVAGVRQSTIIPGVHFNAFTCLPPIPSGTAALDGLTA
jgi:hypothetical protein